MGMRKRGSQEDDWKIALKISEGTLMNLIPLVRMRKKIIEGPGTCWKWGKRPEKKTQT